MTVPRIMTEDERVEIVRQALLTSYNTNRKTGQIYLEDADMVWEARALVVLRALSGELASVAQFDLSQLTRREGTYWWAKDKNAKLDLSQKPNDK